MPIWLVRDRKTFVTCADNHQYDGRLALWSHAPEGVQHVLMETDPERFFYPPCGGHPGRVGVRLEGTPDRNHIFAITEDAYRISTRKGPCA